VTGEEVKICPKLLDVFKGKFTISKENSKIHGRRLKKRSSNFLAYRSNGRQGRAHRNRREKVKFGQMTKGKSSEISAAAGVEILKICVKKTAFQVTAPGGTSM